MLKVGGRSASSRASPPGSRDTISSRRAAANSASSKPYQSPPKNMWPLISPASGACISFIFALISEWPVFHITGTAPAFSSACGSSSEHFTSKITGIPFPKRRTASRPSRIRIWSPQTMRPFSSTAPIRSPSPSNAMPSSAPVRAHLGLEIDEVLRHGRVGMMVGKGAVRFGEERA